MPYNKEYVGKQTDLAVSAANWLAKSLKDKNGLFSKRKPQNKFKLVYLLCVLHLMLVMY